MSDEKSLTKSEIKKIDSRFWKIPYNRKLFQLVTEGKGLEEIKVEMNTTKAKLVRIAAQPSFVRRLQDFFYSHQLKKEVLKVKYFEELAKKVFDILKKGEMSDSAAVKEFSKLLLEGKSKETLGPNLYTLILNFLNANEGAKRLDEAEHAEQVEEAFEYQETKFKDDKDEQQNSEVDSGKEAQDEQEPKD